MKGYLSSLLDFEYESNELFIQAHYEQGHDQLDRVRALICHIINVHHIWISRILDRNVESEDWDDLPYHAWSDLNRENYLITLEAIESRAVTEVISYTTSDGIPMTKTVGEILTHIFYHGNYHRAQINLLLKQADLQPLECNLISSSLEY